MIFGALGVLWKSLGALLGVFLGAFSKLERHFESSARQDQKKDPIWGMTPAKVSPQNHDLGVQNVKKKRCRKSFQKNNTILQPQMGPS